jgi:hypothetical protein
METTEHVILKLISEGYLIEFLREDDRTILISFGEDCDPDNIKAIQIGKDSVSRLIQFLSVEADRMR